MSLPAYPWNTQIMVYDLLLYVAGNIIWHTPFVQAYGVTEWFCVQTWFNPENIWGPVPQWMLHLNSFTLSLIFAQYICLVIIWDKQPRDFDYLLEYNRKGLLKQMLILAMCC